MFLRLYDYGKKIRRITSSIHRYINYRILTLYLRILLRVISKGRDRLLEIEVTGKCHIGKLPL